jgi:hypothetical protein
MGRDVKECFGAPLGYAFGREFVRVMGSDMAASHQDRTQSQPGAYLRSGRFWREDRYALVFVLIILTIVSSAFLSEGPLGFIVTLTLQTITLSVTLRTSEAGRRLRTVGEITGVLVVVGVAAMVLSGNIGPARLAYGLSMIVLVAVTPLVIARRLATHPVVDLNTVTGAADIYLLFGLFFSLVYFVIGELLAQGGVSPAEAFFITSRPVAGNDFIYYSFVTLTTVGYGDIIASSQIARMLSITEALLGQLYLVTVVALLVANIGRSRQRRLLDGAEPEDSGAAPMETD